VPAKLVFP